MESIGHKFKNARKEQGLFIEQVSKDTNISKKYIEAIEEEKFDELPGEAYLLGFLRSYAGYLGINADEIVNIYKKTKIQEQPVPMKELFEPKPLIPFKYIVLIAAASAAVLLAGGLYFFLAVREPAEGIASVEEETVVTGDIYEMNRAFIERRFNEGDTIVINHRNDNYRILFKKASENVVITLPGGETSEIEQGKERFFDLDNDSTNDIRILVRDIDIQEKSAVIKFDKTTEAPAIVASETDIPDNKDTAEAAAAAAPAPAAAVPAAPSPAASLPASSPASAARRKAETDIYQSESRETFTVNMVFRGFCLVRYQSDSQPREERYFHRGETFILNVNSEVRFWLSNAGSVSATVNNTAYSFGGAGEIAARTIKWVDSPDGRGYTIKSLPLY